jgi:hypothetical protein
MNQTDRITSFAEFWPFYVGEHSHPTNRLLHFVGTSGALTCWLAFLFTLKFWFLLLGLVVGYGCAWVGHFFVERNKPASFNYPLWSFAADWRMWWLTLTGRMNTEITRLAHSGR